MVMAVFMTAMSYAQVDTVLFEPGKPGNYELKVDTEKYPYLEGQEVSWFIGFPEVTTTFNPTTNPEVKTVCATPLDSKYVVTIDGKNYLYSESIPSNWFNVDEPWAPTPRTITLFYGHKITKSAVTDEYGTWYSEENLAPYIKDTVAVLHILKDLNTVTPETEDQLISDFTVNEKGGQAYKMTKGDTAKFSAIPTEKLDIQQYALVANEEVIAISNTGYFELVPEETIENIMLVVSNKTGDYTFEGWPKTLNVHPRFDISNLIYTTSSNGKTTIIENPETTEVEVNVFNHDSVSFKVETNVLETKDVPEVSFTWNKDGKSLPEGVQVNKETLIIPEYSKPDMDGTYNCFVSAGDTTIVASFKVASQFPTANEELTLSDVVVASYNGNIVCDNVSQKEVKVINYLGSVVYNKVSTSSRLEIKVNQGIYIVSVDGVNYKIRVK